ncbi:urease accessory protein UreD [Actinomadura sp. 7K507]|uniref:urease accessory protein UreD n=1 Tax=Actinomadura sp. 7K507 TaxID=2530365 RepID=UPI00104AD58E|nr:urease accessory protein UreD [Actinomadura sp. 7K507]TDC89935.1 urease accessory protein UreD [Actinomadura sp. 7K507]
MTRHYTAHAAVRAEPDAAGRTVLTTLRSDGPYALRATPEAVYLVGAAAGPLGGDELHLDLDVAAGATLAVRSVASTLLLPGDGESRTYVRAVVGPGAHLDLAPEPTVAAAGCDHRAVTDVTLAGDATLRWREELVLGRHGETAGRYTGRVDVTLDGRPLLRHELRLPDRVLHTSGAVLGDARCTGSLLLVGPGLAKEACAADGLAVMPLAGPGVLVTALAPDSATLHRRLGRGEETACGTPTGGRGTR